MKTFYSAILIVTSFFFFSCQEKTSLTKGKWTLHYDMENKTMNVEKEGTLIFENLYATYKLGGKVITTKDYQELKIKQEDYTDEIGKGKLFRIIYKGKELPTMVQNFYLYSGKDYLLTDFALESENKVASDYMAPVNIDFMQPLLDRGSNRALFIPFDNDKWIRYQSHPLTFEKLISYEVTSIFNNQNRKGFVIGSVEHDNWKSAVEMIPRDEDNLKSLICYGGVADELTRDSKAHGTLRGERIKSPKILLGFFDDWRTGLEEYADVNAYIAPPKKWDRAMPFGWNSWGVLQFGLTYQKAMEVSDFFRDHLQDNSFHTTDRTVYVGLDSGWNSFTEEELAAFVERCKENDQIAGVYWTPFTDWGKQPERTVEAAPDYKYKQVYLYANGNPQDLDGAYAIDPTHPAVEAQMKKFSELFRRCGFEYVKMDFMTHGAMEADKWYRPEIATGMQAYNYGMNLLNQYFGDMYINLSISPIFPAQYAHSRRIACDAWNKIEDTEYTMNAVSYGWWIDRIYSYNDADHIVLQQATEGENRARITSAVITGLYIAGDDFSVSGSEEGKERARMFLTNNEVNAIAIGKSFRPVEGKGLISENQFYRYDEEGNTWYAVFNYSEEDMCTRIPLERMGLEKEVDYQVKELWSGSLIELDSNFIVPSKDVKLIRISKNLTID